MSETWDNIVVSTVVIDTKHEPLTVVDFVAHMHERDHWCQLWPDARERWAWLFFMGRSGSRVFSGRTPALVCSDGVSRRWRFRDITAAAAAELSLIEAGHVARLESL